MKAGEGTTLAQISLSPPRRAMLAGAAGLVDRLSLGTGVLAAVFLVGIAALILLQVGGRILGFMLPGADDLVAWFTAAASFLALAHTFRAGAHIRVELARSSAPAALRPWLEGISLLLTLLLVGSLAYHACEMAWESYLYDDLAQGQLPVPLWIPQLGLAVGTVVMTLALAEDIVNVLAGRPPSYADRGGASADERAIEEI